MDSKLIRQLRERFRLETLLFRLRQQLPGSELALRQAKFDLREANARSAEYPGSFRSFRDRIKGRQEETELSLRREMAQAEAALEAAQGKQRALEQDISAAEARLAALPGLEELRAQAQGKVLREFFRLDALYCIAVLTPKLDENQRDLVALRDKNNGNHLGKVYAFAEIGEIDTSPIHSGEACGEILRRLGADLAGLEIPFGPWPYYENPAGYLAAAAAHNRRDRINGALDQSRGLQKRLRELKAKLEQVM